MTSDNVIRTKSPIDVAVGVFFIMQEYPKSKMKFCSGKNTANLCGGGGHRAEVLQQWLKGRFTSAGNDLLSTEALSSFSIAFMESNSMQCKFARGNTHCI